LLLRCDGRIRVVLLLFIFINALGETRELLLPESDNLPYDLLPASDRLEKFDFELSEEVLSLFIFPKSALIIPNGEVAFRNESWVNFALADPLCSSFVTKTSFYSNLIIDS